MRVPLGWVRDYVDLPDVTPRQMSDALVGVGLEVEAVHEIAVDGPLVVGRVLEYVDEPQSNGKTIRWCHVDVGSHNPDGEPSRRHRVRGAQLRCRRPRGGRAAGVRAARWLRDHRPEDVRPRLRRDDLLGARARHRRRARRHPRPHRLRAARRRGRRRRQRAPGPSRRGARHRRQARPLLLPLRARHRARARDRLRRAVPRPGRCRPRGCPA